MPNTTRQSRTDDDQHDDVGLDAPMTRLRLSLRTNPFWAIVVLSGIGFAITCLVSVAASLGDPQGPMNQFVVSYGMAAIILEVSLLIGAGLLAMMVDRFQTLRSNDGHNHSAMLIDETRSRDR